MERLAFFESNNTTSTQNWTSPIGVTQIFVQVVDNTTRKTQMHTLTVVPNTVYAIVRTGTGYRDNSPNTFGSIWKWTGGRRLRIYWVE